MNTGMFIRKVRTVAVVAAAGASLALAVAGAGTAFAAGPVFGVSDGMSGESVTHLDGNYFEAGVQVNLGSAFLNIGNSTDNGGTITAKGGVGERLCNQSSGRVADIGSVTTDGKTQTIAFQYGNLPTPGPTGNPCRGDGIIATGIKLHPLLNNLPVSDPVLFFEHVYKNGMRFSAEDVANGDAFQQWVSFTTCHIVPGHEVKGHWVGSSHHRVWIPGHWVKQQNVCTTSRPWFDSAEFGAIDGTALASGDPLADFTGAYVAGSNHIHTQVQPGYPGLNYVNSGANGNPPWLVAVAGTSENSTNGPATPLAPDAVECNPNPPANTTLVDPTYSQKPSPGGDFSLCVASPVGNA